MDRAAAVKAGYIFRDFGHHGAKNRTSAPSCRSSAVKKSSNASDRTAGSTAPDPSRLQSTSTQPHSHVLKRARVVVLAVSITKIKGELETGTFTLIFVFVFYTQNMASSQ